MAEGVVVTHDVFDDILWLARKAEERGEYYCPQCAPDVDPTERGRCWTIAYCGSHQPDRMGTADLLVPRRPLLAAVMPGIEASPGEGP